MTNITQWISVLLMCLSLSQVSYQQWVDPTDVDPQISANIPRSPTLLELRSAQQCSLPKTNPDDCNPESFIPDAPLLMCGFPNQTAYDLGLQAVSEAFELARNALQMLEDDPDNFSFTRYFDTRTSGMLETVKTVFKALLGPDGTGTPELRIPGVEVELWYDQYSSTYNEKDLLCSSPTLFGVMRGIACGDFNLHNSRSWITICSRAFEGRWRTLKEINCQGLADRVSGDHLAPANVVLHELVHWGPLTEKYANFSIGDLGYGP